MDSDNEPIVLNRFRPAIGHPIEMYPVEVIDASDRYRTSRTRDRIAIMMAFSLIVATAIAALLSILWKDFDIIAAVWSATGPILGALLTYYFKGKESE
jgi:hypothetical protein